jgi:glycosyltransferase involved in cell wall biosynthesis
VSLNLPDIDTRTVARGGEDMSRAQLLQLSLVVPCFNEESVLPETASRLVRLFRRLIATAQISSSSQIYFVDDGSTDRTWELVQSLAAEEPAVKGIKLSRNCGHQFALLAGLLTVPGDAVISIDADLQDDVSAIPEMLEAYNRGSEIVYGVRRKREADTFLKRVTATGYYRILARLGVDVVYNHSDFRLMGRRALTALADYGEVNVFLRGIVPQLGFRSSVVQYDRLERFAGESKYPLTKMLALAWNGVTSFSAVPLRMITAMGFVISLLSIGITIWALCVRLFTDHSVPGWASTVMPTYLMGGLQLFAIGLIGEYLAKTYMETKRRPKFFIEKVI